MMPDYYGGKRQVVIGKKYEPRKMVCGVCKGMWTKRSWNAQCPCQRDKK